MDGGQNQSPCFCDLRISQIVDDSTEKKIKKSRNILATFPLLMILMELSKGECVSKAMYANLY